MGARYLTELADVCRAAGLSLTEVDGWETRARGSGGYATGCPTHIMIHHTASPSSADGWPDVNYCTFNDDDAPLCNIYLGRSGQVWVCAAGATNTNGSGRDPCGVTPDDSMNSHAIGIEAGNDGRGEPWPDAQLDAYVRLAAALADHYGLGAGRIHAHAEWAPDRKVDPAGPPRYAVGAATWNMADFRSDCDGVAPTPFPPPPLDPEEDDMPRYLVQHPGPGDNKGKWMLTDTATYRTDVIYPGSDAALEQLRKDGVALFGWQDDGNGPWLLGPQWGPLLDSLPAT